MAEYLENQKNVEVHYNTYVDKIEKKGEEWSIKTKNKDKVKKTYRADNVLSAA
jgi:L-2-hydroxyglutarate oxidase LhgO